MKRCYVVMGAGLLCAFFPFVWDVCKGRREYGGEKARRVPAASLRWTAPRTGNLVTADGRTR